MEQFLSNLKQYATQLYAQLKDLYLSMTFGNRIVASLLFATLFISLGYLIVGSIKPADPRSKTTMMYDGYQFTANEKAAAEFAFSGKRMTDHNWVGNQLQIPTSQKAAYALAIAEGAVLDKDGMARLGAAKNLNPFQSSRMVETQMNAAKERDAIDAIMKIPGISNVSILTHRRPEWERNVWARRQVMSVAVVVEAIENKPLKVETITAIGNLIAPVFGITDRKEISITDSKNSRSYDGFGEEVSSAQGEYLRHQLRHQEEWNNRIYLLFPTIAGLKVDTSVTLTTYRSQRLFGVEHGKPTPLVDHQMDFHLKREGFDRFFRPGQIAQWSRPLIDPTGNVSPKDLVEEKKREQEITNALQGTETNQEQLPYIPLKVTTSLQVPREYILAIWQERNRLLGNDPDVKPTPEELRAEEEDFRSTTKRSIGKLLEPYRVSAKEDTMNFVEVIYYDTLRPAEVTLTAWEQFLFFLQHHWQSIGLMSLVFGGLVVLWSISKPPKPDSIVIYEGLETPMEAIDARIAERARRAEEEAAAAAAAAEEEQRAFENSLGELGSIRSLREEIAELIAKNPEAAAAVIRQWVGNAVLVEAKT